MNDDYYYMVGKPVDASDVRAYRVDKMKNTALLHAPAEREPANFSTEDYSVRIFDMFEGETQEVELSWQR